MMEKFLKDYIEEIADLRGIELNKTQLAWLTDDVSSSDVWDTVDYYINSLLDELEEEDERGE